MSEIYRGDPNLRVGDVERSAAIEDLNAHWRAGRLDPAEHEARTTRAHHAQTRGDLQELFVDQPPVDLSAVGAVGGPASSPVPGPPPGAIGPPGSFVDRYRSTFAALVPFGAVLLFFLTKSWLWFLLVPVALILLQGPKKRL